MGCVGWVDGEKVKAKVEVKAGGEKVMVMVNVRYQWMDVWMDSFAVFLLVMDISIDWIVILIGNKYRDEYQGEYIHQSIAT